MRKVNMLGVALATTTAALAVGVGAASAAAPEFGACNKVGTPKTGEYTGPSCVKKAVGNKGAYNWVPGPPAKPKFEATGENIQLETVGKRKVTCGAAIITGEYTGPKTEKLTKVNLVGCTDSLTQQSCSTAPLVAEAEIESSGPLNGELGYIVGGERPIVGIDLKPAAGNVMFAFTCGLPPNFKVIETVEGSVIGKIVPLNKLTEEFKVIYHKRNGIQQYEAFEGGAKDTLISNLTVGTTTTTEATAFGGTVIYTAEEAQQIKSK